MYNIIQFSKHFEVSKPADKDILGHTILPVTLMLIFCL